MKKFWIVSVPGERGSQAPRIRERAATAGKISELVDTFNIPIKDLRVGTYDSLISLSDDLIKIDYFVEQTTKKIAIQLYQLLDEKPTNLGTVLSINSLSVDVYLKRFQWDEARYQVKNPLKEIVETIQSQVGRLDEEIKSKSSEYNNLLHTILAEEKKQSGSLMIRSLNDIVNSEDLVETESLTTILVVVPKYLAKEWESSYERLHEFVLPRSSREIFFDSEHTIYTLVCLKKFADDIKAKCRERRFTVRDFTYDPSAFNTGKEKIRQLSMDKEGVKNNLLRWCRVNFAEAFIAWAHLKAIRIFVESILRFGLPPAFDAVVIEPTKRGDRKLRDMLNALYNHLSSSHLTGKDTDLSDIPLIGIVNQEKFYPYVYSEILLDLGGGSD